MGLATLCRMTCSAGAVVMMIQAVLVTHLACSGSGCSSQCNCAHSSSELEQPDSKCCRALRLEQAQLELPDEETCRESE